MKHAKLLSLGGMIISAEEADYSDYHRLLICAHCHELVFFRRGFTYNKSSNRPGRLGKSQESKFIHASFYAKTGFKTKDLEVYSLSVPYTTQDVSTCKDVIDNYTSEELEALQRESAAIRLNTLTTSMWDCLKTNLAVNLNTWDEDLKLSQMKLMKALAEVNKLGLDIIEKYSPELLIQQLHATAVILEDNIPDIRLLNSFAKGKDRSWSLHTKISVEALEVFLTPSMREVRIRLLAVLCNIKRLSLFALIDEDITTLEWKDSFTSYLITQVVLIFLTIDWLKVLKVDSLPTSNTNL